MDLRSPSDPDPDTVMVTEAGAGPDTISQTEEELAEEVAQELDQERKLAKEEELGRELDEEMTQEHDEEMAQEHEGEERRVVYKSWKKKYKKIKVKFDEAQRVAKELFAEEQRAIALSERMALENDQLMDLLLDMNDNPNIRSDKRIDLNATSAVLPAIPSLVTDEELAFAAEVDTPAGKAMYKEIQAMLEEEAKAQPPESSIPKKSLAGLLVSVNHLTASNPQVPRELIQSLEKDNPSYLTMDRIDEHLYSIDAPLGLALPRHRTESEEEARSLVKAFSHGHSLSAYNWLRNNVPKVFLQDGESDKPLGKPGALRGAGKRASIPAPSQPDNLEIVEEDGIGYDFSLGTQLDAIKGKRKRDDDGPGYQPKKGAGSMDGDKVRKPRQPRKKKGEGSEEKAPSARKKKAKQPSPDPEAHPFGPI